MRFATLLLVAGAIVLFAAPAWTVCPVHPNPGTYSTYAGTIMPGRDSEAWCTGAGPGKPGNTDNAESWNGTTLGSQWRVWGMQIDANGGVETGRNLDASGNGWIDYRTNYTGGQFWLSRSHTWSDGINDLTGAVSYFNVATRVTLVLGQIRGATSNIYFTGVFNECPACTLEYVISNAMLVWMPGWPDMPANYPALQCGASLGELFDVCCIQASIYCPVANGESTWGAIKELYR